MSIENWLVFPYLGAAKLGLNCKSTSKEYLTSANWSLFLKVKINFVIIFALKTLLLKFLHQLWFKSFSVNYAMSPITENVLDTLLQKVVNVLVFHQLIKGYSVERIVLYTIICQIATIHPLLKILVFYVPRISSTSQNWKKTFL